MSYRNRIAFLLLLLPILPISRTSATYQAPDDIPVIAPEFIIIQGEVTKYSSEVGQTDESPFITANGDHVGKGTIACPGNLPFGTKVEILGEKYICNDRMAKRYRDGNYFDVWTEKTSDAIQWGRQQQEIKIFKE